MEIILINGYKEKIDKQNFDKSLEGHEGYDTHTKFCNEKYIID